MWEALEAWFAGSFMPHGHCYLWSPAMVWLQVLSNLTIAIAYVSISGTIAVILRRIRDIPFSRMYVAFGVFIVTCGLTHFLDVATIWHPIYWLDGGVRAVTALASAGTAVMLLPLVPKAVGLARAAETAHARGLELESTYKELATSHERTKELERAKTEFFANISHELRTPLALVLGPTEKLLGDASITAEQRRDLETIARNGRTLLKHVNDLLDVAKLDVDKLEPGYARVDVAGVVRRVAEQFDGLARDRAARLEVRVPDHRVAEVDPSHLERILANLVGNAFKFTPRGGTVRVSIDSGATHDVRLEVADDGPGVPESLRETIFERFSQGDAGVTRSRGGTGLGLAIVKELAELHRGTVRVDVAPEGGALFVVTLPAKAPDGATVSEDPESTTPTALSSAPLALEVATARAATTDADIREAATLAMRRALEGRKPSSPTRAPSTTDDPPAPASGPRRPVVLVAEDNVEMNAFIAGALAPRWDVLRAHDGDQALALAQERTPDLVVTDIMMPSKSGEELVAAFQADERLADVPVVVLTARSDDALRVRLLRHGASDYVMKPFSAEELVARVANLVAMKRARDLLRTELASRATDVEDLAGDLAARKRDLETALTNLRVARDHAEQASQYKTAFLAMVSHELRTPLTTVQLLVDRMTSASAELPPSLQKTAQRMSNAVVRLTSLVESLLQYARLQSGRLSVQPVPVEPRKLVESALDDIRPQAQQKGLVLALDVADDAMDLVIETDATLARVIVTNLVANAVKFTSEGSVTVSVLRAPPSRATDGRSLASSGVILRVRDTGPGIPAAEQARIFDPFHRLEPARNAHVPGVGLGLSLVRDLVDNLGGRVTVTSELGDGATFEVSLPSTLDAPELRDAATR